MDLYMNVDNLANQLGVSSSTVKKYYLLIEDKGYKFRRDIKGHVSFTQDDLQLFKAIFQLKSQPKTSIESAINQALGYISIPEDVDEENSEDTRDITSIADMKVITEEINKLNSRIDEQKYLINEQNRMINEMLRSNRKNQLILEDKKEESLLEQNLEETNNLKDLVNELNNKIENQKPWWKFW